jgi:hypothetical protein
MQVIFLTRLGMFPMKKHCLSDPERSLRSLETFDVSIRRDEIVNCPLPPRILDNDRTCLSK